mgnify:CR=1 FL=1
MSARIITDSDFSHLLTDEQRQQATKEVIVELTDEIKTLKDEIKTLKEKNINACAEIKALKEDIDFSHEVCQDTDFAPATAEDAMKWRMLKAFEGATHLQHRRRLERADIYEAMSDHLDDDEIDYEWFEKNYRLVRVGNTIKQKEDIIDYMKTTEDSGKCGDNLNAFSFLSGTRNSPRFTTLYNNNLHFAFEKADNRQDTEWFKKYNTLYSDFFAHHMKMTAGVFEWSFYEAFLTQNEK